jgi:hypothetical protein
VKSFRRLCLSCDDPALGTSLYCEPCRVSANQAHTEDPLVNRRIDQDRHVFKAPARGWITRRPSNFDVMVDQDENDIHFSDHTTSRNSEDEVGFFDVRMRHDPYIDSYGVTLEEMQADGIIP